MKKKRKVRTLDVVLVVMAAFLLVFIVVMLWLYYRTGGIPDTLCTCVFAISGGECGVMGWIKTTKERFRDRKYELEDREHEEKRQEAMSGILDRNAPGDAG